MGVEHPIMLPRGPLRGGPVLVGLVRLPWVNWRVWTVVVRSLTVGSLSFSVSWLILNVSVGSLP